MGRYGALPGFIQTYLIWEALVPTSEANPGPSWWIGREPLRQLADLPSRRVPKNGNGHDRDRAALEIILGVSAVEPDDVHAERQTPVRTAHRAPLHVPCHVRPGRTQFGDLPRRQGAAKPGVELHGVGCRSAQRHHGDGYDQADGPGHGASSPGRGSIAAATAAAPGTRPYRVSSSCSRCERKANSAWNCLWPASPPSQCQSAALPGHRHRSAPYRAGEHGAGHFGGVCQTGEARQHHRHGSDEAPRTTRRTVRHGAASRVGQDVNGVSSASRSPGAKNMASNTRHGSRGSRSQGVRTTHGAKDCAPQSKPINGKASSQKSGLDRTLPRCGPRPPSQAIQGALSSS